MYTSSVTHIIIIQCQMSHERYYIIILSVKRVWIIFDGSIKWKTFFKDKTDIPLLMSSIIAGYEAAFIDIQTRNNPCARFPRERVYYIICRQPGWRFETSLSAMIPVWIEIEKRTQVKAIEPQCSLCNKSRICFYLVSRRVRIISLRESILTTKGRAF